MYHPADPHASGGSHYAFWLPKPPWATDPVYTRLMNQTETAPMIALSTSTSAVHLLGTVPTGEWFTALSADVQGDITEMVNEAGYPLSDIRDFIEQYGVQAYSDGYYVAWCELTEQGATNEAIEAFAEEFGIYCLESFEDAYRGEYESQADFAEQYTNDCYTMGNIPDWVVIDWQATWDTELSNSFEYNNGHVFISTW